VAGAGARLCRPRPRLRGGEPADRRARGRAHLGSALRQPRGLRALHPARAPLLLARTGTALVLVSLAAPQVAAGHSPALPLAGQESRRGAADRALHPLADPRAVAHPSEADALSPGRHALPYASRRGRGVVLLAERPAAAGGGPRGPLPAPGFLRPHFPEPEIHGRRGRRPAARDVADIPYSAGDDLPLPGLGLRLDALPGARYRIPRPPRPPLSAERRGARGRPRGVHGDRLLRRGRAPRSAPPGAPSRTRVRRNGGIPVGGQQTGGRLSPSRALTPGPSPRPPPGPPGEGSVARRRRERLLHPLPAATLGAGV
jgi:hypothetical protein